MATPSWREELPKRVRVLQIIIAAMVIGCSFFAFIALVMAPTVSLGAGSPFITYIALAFAVISLGPRLVMPLILAAAGRKNILQVLRTEHGGSGSMENFEKYEEEAGYHLFALLQRKTITCAALIEGPTFFLLVAYIVEHSPLALAAAGIMLFILATPFPTVDRSANWIEGQLQLLKQQYCS